MKFIIKLILSAVAVMVSAYLLPGVEVNGFFVAIVVAAVLALLNTIVKPILILLTIPITVLTLGIFLLVINAVIILLADMLIQGFSVYGFWWALLFSLILAIFNSLLGGLKTEN
ncbi:MAG: phage holin family protein [Cytophagales bacterium]|nr:phage holin family protein [Cytophagales bacterium]